MYYLDPARKHRLLVAINRRCGAQLCHLVELARQGQGGSATVAVVATDLSLAHPQAPSGVYLLRLVQPAGTSASHLELCTPDLRSVAAWGAPSRLQISELDKEADMEEASMGCNPLFMPANAGAVLLDYGPLRARSNTFPVQFRVTGRPDDKSTQFPGKLWAGGMIFVKKP